VNVVGYLSIAENMPGGGAQRPSDVITIYGGKTVEVLNTDAEGRLVLADALARSEADRPSLLIDVATLTGAQTVALGNRTAGVMASDDSLAAEIADAARRAGEAMWPMPLPEDLRKGLDSTVADIANVSGTAVAACSSPGCSFASSCRPGSAGLTWTSPAPPTTTGARTATSPRVARGRRSGRWCRSRPTWRRASLPVARLTASEMMKTG
jgi:Leucyl aminopeptidase